MERGTTHGSLFSGIGGFELGAQWAGIDTVWNCEIMPYQRTILKKHFPKTKQYADIRELQQPERVDIVSGGFPCQDISLAGKGEGINGARSGLWGEMYRIVREVRPRFVIIENSTALTFRGLERVLCDLSEAGYNAEWRCLSNAEFGFDHIRERIYIIAYADKVERQEGRIQEWDFVETIFVETPKKYGGLSLAERVHKMPDHERIGEPDGVRFWTHRVGALGNSVNAVVAYYLFMCIKKWIERHGDYEQTLE